MFFYWENTHNLEQNKWGQKKPDNDEHRIRTLEL